MCMAIKGPMLLPLAPKVVKVYKPKVKINVDKSLPHDQSEEINAEPTSDHPKDKLVNPSSSSTPPTEKAAENQPPPTPTPDDINLPSANIKDSNLPSKNPHEKGGPCSFYNPPTTLSFNFQPCPCSKYYK